MKNDLIFDQSAFCSFCQNCDIIKVWRLLGLCTDYNVPKIYMFGFVPQQNLLRLTTLDPPSSTQPDDYSTQLSINPNPNDSRPIKSFVPFSLIDVQYPVIFLHAQLLTASIIKACCIHCIYNYSPLSLFVIYLEAFLSGDMQEFVGQITGADLIKA